MKKRQLFALALAASCAMPMMFAGCSSDSNSKTNFDEYEAPSQEYWAIFKGEIGDVPCKIHTVQKLFDNGVDAFSYYYKLSWLTKCGYYNVWPRSEIGHELLFNKDGIMLSTAQYSIGPATAYEKTDLSSYEFCEECFPEKGLDK